MPRTLARFAVIAPLLLLIGWTPASEQRIARKGAELAPPDLKLLIDLYSEDYQNGLARAAAAGAQRSSPGTLQSEIERETQSAIRMVRTHQPLTSFVERLGVLAHLVGRANNPFSFVPPDSRLAPSADDFARYLDSRMSVFPTVFYGLDDDLRLDRYVGGMLNRTRRLTPLLDEEYFRFGQRRNWRDFDDHSTAFGVASLSYSHSVTDLVNLYYYIWKEAGGDVRTARALRKGNLLLNEHAR
ncbi:MAG: hypothetical protein WBX15_00475 [Thermoanaerobaculia bacterium]